MNNPIRHALLVFAAAAALVSALANGNADGSRPLKLQGANMAADTANPEMVSGFIVKPHRRRGAKLAHALRSRDARALSKIAGVSMRVHRQMSDDAHVLRLDQPVTLAEAKSISAQLMRDGDIELAEPDRILHSTTVLPPPTDPAYSQITSAGVALQWHYYPPSGANKGGANLPNAWNRTVGVAAIKVAVLDTGYRPHSDLATVLTGYDFVTSDVVGNDAQSGRDTDATDPGDNCSTASVTTSSWHGTHVAGTIAALMSNAGPPGLHGTGIAPEIGLVPVRVLGKCGGVTSDIVDAMRWAAGIAVPGAPANANPAQVLNLSLGGSGACSASFQSAVTDVVNQGAVVVVAAGNDAAIGLSQPANCSGVIAVTAHAIDGDNASYANIAKQVAISAPGGGCGTLTTSATCSALLSANGLGVYSLSNSGTTAPASPGGDTYKSGAGTSMATPHVSGVIALMLSLNSSLSRPALTPGQIKSYLQSSARPHPAGSTCTLSRYSGLCGEGLLDAEGALTKTDELAPALTLAESYQVVAPGQNVQLSGTRTIYAGRAPATFSWTQGPSVSVGLSGTSVSGDTATASFSAPATAGVYTFLLTAQDSAAKVGTATATVKVNSAPVLSAVPAQAVTVGAALSFNVAATDPDGDAVAFTHGTLPTGATFSGGTFTWSSATPVGSYTVTYSASDPDGATTTDSVTINVAAPASGGGGNMDGESLTALALLAACMRVRRARKLRCARPGQP
jgi:serine protease